jgi:hypothetical protein
MCQMATSEANFSERRTETVRKVPEAPETRAHKAPELARSACFGPDRRARYTPGASIVPLFGQFPYELGRINLPRTPVNKGKRRAETAKNLGPYWSRPSGPTDSAGARVSRFRVGRRW